MSYLITNFLFYKYLSLETKIPVAKIQNIFDYVKYYEEYEKRRDPGSILINPPLKDFTKEELTDLSNIMSLLGDHARTFIDRGEINIVTNVPGSNSLDDQIKKLLYQINSYEKQTW